jgi:hypothetical protein
MNIFFLHWNTRICAMMHVDKHVIKMILETCQLLCTTHHVTESKYTPPYKMTHKNHPCTKWVRESVGNYKYLVKLGKELCKEYTYRYGKIHKCQAYIKEMGKNIPPIPDNGFTPPAQAMPDEYKSKNAVESYRAYYYFEKMDLHTWKKRKVPWWVIETRKLFEK